MRKAASDIWCGASLALLLAIIVLWVRSYNGGDAVAYRVPRGDWRPDDWWTHAHKAGPSGASIRQWRITSNRGRLGFGTREETWEPDRILLLVNTPGWTTSQFEELAPNASRIERRFIAFGIERESGDLRRSNSCAYRTWRVAAPHWFIAVLMSLIPLRRLRAHVLRRRRQQRNLCPNCGYDIRESADRCPECGHVPAEVQSPPT